MDDWTGAQRYSVTFDPGRQCWVVVEAVSVPEVVGVHPTEGGALSQANAEQDRWKRYAVFAWS